MIEYSVKILRKDPDLHRLTVEYTRKSDGKQIVNSFVVHDWSKNNVVKVINQGGVEAVKLMVDHDKEVAKNIQAPDIKDSDLELAAYEQVLEDVPPARWNERIIENTRIENGKQVIGWTTRPLSHLEKLDVINSTSKDYVHNLLTRFANNKGYDDINSMASYANSTNPIWKVEGQIAVKYRDLIWDSYYKRMDDILQGSYSIDSIAELEEIFIDLPLADNPNNFNLERYKDNWDTNGELISNSNNSHPLNAQGTPPGPQV